MESGVRSRQVFDLRIYSHRLRPQPATPFTEVRPAFPSWDVRVRLGTQAMVRHASGWHETHADARGFSTLDDTYADRRPALTGMLIEEKTGQVRY